MTRSKQNTQDTIDHYCNASCLHVVVTVVTVPPFFSVSIHNTASTSTNTSASASTTCGPHDTFTMRNLFSRKEPTTTPITANVHVVVSDDEEDYFTMTPSTKGMLVSTMFTFAYFLRPIHLAIPGLMIAYGNHLLVRQVGYLMAFVCFLSFVLPPKEASFLVAGLLAPILEYFQYDEIIENSPIHIQESIKDGKQYIFACQPHGMVPFCSIAWSIRQAQQKRKTTPTAVASMVLWTPILKHIMGSFGCVTAAEMKQSLHKKQSTSVRLYVGSTTDIFYCNDYVEVLQLTKRKRFIQVALQMGVDIIPVYMFGNTTLFSQWNHSWLVKISRWVQFPVTYAWGRFGLPIPRKKKVRRLSNFQHTVCRGGQLY
jgi:hypothetical protein